MGSKDYAASCRERDAKTLRLLKEQGRAYASVPLPGSGAKQAETWPQTLSLNVPRRQSGKQGYAAAWINVEVTSPEQAAKFQQFFAVFHQARCTFGFSDDAERELQAMLKGDDELKALLARLQGLS